MALSLPLLKGWGLQGEAEHFSKARQYFKERPFASAHVLKQLMENNPTVETIDHVLHTLLTPTTLVIAGAQDSVIPLAHAKLYAKQIPEVESLWLNDAEHNLHITHVQRIAKRILDWNGRSAMV